MTPQARIRRIGWIFALAVCTALYLALHLKVHSVKSEVVRAERQIVALEQQNVLLETEFHTRSSQLQLARWNRVDFGYVAPEASQFISSERQLAALGDAPAGSMQPDIQLAGFSPEDEADHTPELISPLTGEPVDQALLEPESDDAEIAPRLAIMVPQGPMRINLSAAAGVAKR